MSNVPKTLMTAAEANASTEAPAAETSATEAQQPVPPGDTPPAENQPAETGEEVNYAFQFAEGLEVDPTSLDDLKTLAKDLKLPMDQAQKIADLGAKQAQRWAEAQEQAIQNATAQWIEQVKADKEIGGEANLAVAKTALSQFGTPELTALLNESRLGNHPEVIRFFYKVGKAIGDDAVIPGSRTTNRAADPARRMYDNSNLA